jgi:hypothetical protein
VSTGIAARGVAGAGRVVKSRRFPRRAQRAILEWKWSRDGRRAHGVPRRPRTFNDKVRFKMTSDRRPLLATFSDKVAAREYVTRVVGSHVLAKLYLVTDDPEEVRRESLPREVAVKAAHGSGGCVLVAESADPERALAEPPAGWARFLVHPDSVDWVRLRGLCSEWLGLRYGSWEWGYRDLQARILAEELLQDGGAVPTDFKLFTFNGRVRLVEVDFDRYGSIARTLYTPGWELVPVRFKYPRGPEAPRPDALGEMIAMAERLAAPVDFLRVDFYVLGSRIVVGELTSYPGAGASKVDPESFDAELGSWWSQPRVYR